MRPPRTPTMPAASGAQRRRGAAAASGGPCSSPCTSVVRGNAVRTPNRSTPTAPSMRKATGAPPTNARPASTRPSAPGSARATSSTNSADPWAGRSTPPTKRTSAAGTSRSTKAPSSEVSRRPMGLGLVASSVVRTTKRAPSGVRSSRCTPDAPGTRRNVGALTPGAAPGAQAATNASRAHARSARTYGRFDLGTLASGAGAERRDRRLPQSSGRAGSARGAA